MLLAALHPQSHIVLITHALRTPPAPWKSIDGLHSAAWLSIKYLESEFIDYQIHYDMYPRMGLHQAPS